MRSLQFSAWQSNRGKPRNFMTYDKCLRRRGRPGIATSVHAFSSACKHNFRSAASMKSGLNGIRSPSASLAFFNNCIKRVFELFSNSQTKRLKRTVHASLTLSRKEHRDQPVPSAGKSCHHPCIPVTFNRIVHMFRCKIRPIVTLPRLPSSCSSMQ